MMRGAGWICGIIFCGALASSPCCAGEGDISPILGFTSAESIQQRSLEADFDQFIDRQNLDLWMRHLSAKPHHTGSAVSYAKAGYLANLFKSWGYETRIETFHVLNPVPKTLKLEMVAPAFHRTRFYEPPLSGSSDADQESILPIYNAYAPDGQAEAEVVYVNYGRRQDYDVLAQIGISVAGRIVIARYGKIWRGLKPQIAAEHGAVAALIYSDPRDDGYLQGKVMPEGPFRPATGAERGSALDIIQYPGDPQTPFQPSVAGATRLKLEDVSNLAKIPTLVLTYADAEIILKELAGLALPQTWEEGLPFDLKAGPGPAKVRLKTRYHWQITPIYNVIARLDGEQDPDQWVVRGNHHDAWVYGAADPVSGVVTLLEEARVLAALAKSGRRPKRTIIYALWDAEEQGMIGSTEWVEKHRRELMDKAVAYINTDLYSRGFLEVGGSHSLQKFVTGIARDVTDPQTGDRVGDRLDKYIATSDRWFFNASSSDIKSAANGLVPMMPLGGGSDFTAFLHHLGIPTLQIGYFGEGLGGEFHSRYDTYDNFQKYGDPDFDYGVTMVQTTGRAVMRLANAQRLPFTFTGLSQNLALFTAEIKKISDGLKAQAGTDMPDLDFSAIIHALDNLTAASNRLDSALARIDRGDLHMPDEALQAVNHILWTAEHRLIAVNGLPGRPWYRHLIYAPGGDTGYDVSTLPGLRDAIQAGRWDDAMSQKLMITDALLKLSKHLDEGHNHLVDERAVRSRKLQ